MTTLLVLIMLGCAFRTLFKAAPGAVKFGLENRQALSTGATVLKRMFTK